MKKNEFEKIRITIFADNTENAIEMLEKKVTELKVQKEKEKWAFTEDEKVILRNLARDIEWIVRDKDGALWAFEGKPSREDTFWFGDVSCIKYEVDCFSHLFQCIQWTDIEPCEFRKYI